MWQSLPYVNLHPYLLTRSRMSAFSFGLLPPLLFEFLLPSWVFSQQIGTRLSLILLPVSQHFFQLVRSFFGQVMCFSLVFL